MPFRSFRTLLNETSAGLFERGGLEEIFQHARNILVATLIAAAGMHGVEHAADLVIPPFLDYRVAGYGVTALGVLLFVLNVVDGWHKLSNAEYPLYFRVIALSSTSWLHFASPS